MSTKKCSVDGCESRHYGKGFCNKHYLKQYQRPAASLERKKEKLKEWRKANKERIQEYEKQHRAANKEYYAAKRRRYYEAHKEKEREQNAGWHKQNKALAALKSNRYRTRKLKASPTWLSEVHNEQIKLFYEAASAYSAHIDHIVPLKGKDVCGLHVPWNLSLTTKQDNSIKKNKLTKEGEQLAWTSVS